MKFTQFMKMSNNFENLFRQLNDSLWNSITFSLKMFTGSLFFQLSCQLRKLGTYLSVYLFPEVYINSSFNSKS